MVIFLIGSVARVINSLQLFQMNTWASACDDVGKSCWISMDISSLQGMHVQHDHLVEPFLVVATVPVNGI